MVKKSRVGRPRGITRARAAILDAAQHQFNAVGYRNATIRSIAAGAGVDAAMIGYYFGSKHALLGEVLQLRVDPAGVLANSLDHPIAEIPERVLPRVFAAWEAPEHRPTLLIGVGDDPTLGRMLKGFIESELLWPIARRLRAEGIGRRESERRAGAFATQLVGVVFARYVVEVGPIVDLAVDDLVGLVAPALKATLAGE